ncbi:MAG: HAMP domain-containing histidine kinase [Lachnospiraceae bacterium]|nr:HAMP domain-containing histidine kinase [Lachnospiraceae bacterium]
MKKYFFKWGSIYVLLLALLLSLAIVIFGMGAVKDAIRTSLSKDIQHIQKCLLEDKDVIINDGCLYILYGRDHNIISTNATDELSSETMSELSNNRKPSYIHNLSEFQNINNYLYCIKTLHSRHLSDKYGEPTTLLTLLPVSLVQNTYFTFIVWLVIGVIIVSLLMITMLNIWSRRYEGIIDDIIIRAEKIGNNDDFSERIDNNIKYPELVALIDAHNRLLNRVEDIIKSQKDYGRNLSHELKTPIGIISAQCQYLKDNNYDPKNMPEYISRIERQNNHMRDLTSQLLILSKLDDPSIKEQLEQISLDEIIIFLCSDIEESENLTNIFDLHLEHISVEANMSYLIILIENLLTNALKYGMSDKPIEVNLSSDPEMIILTVADHGGGIPENNEDKVFEPYYRSDNSIQTEGFGLGLTLAKKIAMHYGGDVEVNSKLGMGSTFVVHLNLPLI